MARTVIHFTDADEFGGAEQILLHTMTGLDRNLWRPVLFHHPAAGLKLLLGKLRGSSIKTHAVPRIRGLANINRLPQFIRALRNEAPVIFHAHLNWPLACKYELIAAAAARVPVVVATAHTCQEFPKHQILLRAQPRLIAAAVDRYIAVSQAVARTLCEGFQIPCRKIRIVHNGVSIAASEERHGVRKYPVALMTGRLSKEKGVEYLLRAAALVPHLTVELAGEGPERASLEAKARELGIDDRVSFLGHREDVTDLLANCDVFVLPSLTEGLPVSVLEAMAASRPVIASEVGGNKEVVVHGETGLLVPPRDAAALADALRATVCDPALARQFGAAGKARVEQEFSDEMMVRRVTQIYNELLDSRVPPHAPN
jgi:glycosyltransferase involved in cell wall biosynthesis